MSETLDPMAMKLDQRQLAEQLLGVFVAKKLGTRGGVRPSEREHHAPDAGPQGPHPAEPDW